MAKTKSRPTIEKMRKHKAANESKRLLKGVGIIKKFPNKNETREQFRSRISAAMKKHPGLEEKLGVAFDKSLPKPGTAKRKLRFKSKR